MTLQTFLKVTAATPASDLRRAITLALSIERPASPEAYSRFYRRVLGELRGGRRTAGIPRAEQAVNAAA